MIIINGGWENAGETEGRGEDFKYRGGPSVTLEDSG